MASERHAWARSIGPALLVAAVAGVVGVVVNNIIDSLRVGEVRDGNLSERLAILETEHQPWRRHMGGTGIAPRNDHPGRNVENPTEPERPQ